MDKKYGIILRDLLLEALDTYREDHDDKDWLCDLVAKEIKKAKEGILLSPEVSETHFYGEAEDYHEDMLATSYAIELCSLIPAASERAAKIFPLLTMKKIDSALERYLEEAVRCYIYGFSLSALIMCRLAIEYSLKKYLKIAENDSRGYTIYRLLDEALNKCDSISKIDMDLVRNLHKEASNCVHGRNQIDSDECLDYLNYTKVFLDRLFR